MNKKFNKNAKVEQLTKVVLSHGEEKGLILKYPVLQDGYLEVVFFSRRNTSMVTII